MEGLGPVSKGGVAGFLPPHPCRRGLRREDPQRERHLCLLRVYDRPSSPIHPISLITSPHLLDLKIVRQKVGSTSPGVGPGDYVVSSDAHCKVEPHDPLVMVVPILQMRKSRLGR